MISRHRTYVTASIILFIAGTARAVDPNPLENAYWRFEEGTAGTKVPEGDNTVLDYTINSNHMMRFNPDPPADFHAPTYTTDVAGPVVPATGELNTLSLYFDGGFPGGVGGVDIYASVKNINNPLVTTITVEASFKTELVGVGQWQTVICKESRSDDESSPIPPFVLKITGDGNNVLRLEGRDRGNNAYLIDSVAQMVPGQWYHAAVVATSTEIKLYLDENNGMGYELQGTAPISGGGPLYQGTADSYESTWTIGKGMWARVLTDWFVGWIDEVRISNTALEPSEFLWYDAGLPGDFNNDGRVDGADFELFRQCATGADVPYQPTLPPACTMTPENGLIPADLDEDGDVDMDDFGIFQANYTG
jgi:hypothetical protein